MKIIAYPLFGDDRMYEAELAFSVLSALRFLNAQAEEVKFCIISDSKESLLQQGEVGVELPIERLTFSKQDLANWTYNGAYIYRAKLFALKKAIDYYQAPVVLLDTDTYFLDHPFRLFERIAPGRSVMHVCEGAIVETKLWQPMIQEIGSGIQVAGSRITAQSPMVNSGVIGIDPADFELIDAAIELLDQLYQIVPLINVEQFAIGTVLAQKTQLAMSGDLIEHYWGTQKEFIRVQIMRAMRENTIANVDQLLEKKPAFPSVFPRIRWRDRMITTLRFLLHRNHDYRRAQLSYRTALFYAKKEPDYANAWAYTALKALQFSRHRDRREHRQIFRHLRLETLERITWLEPATRRGWMKFWQQSG